MHTMTAILMTAVFMLVMTSASFAQDTTSDDDANKPYPVCFTWKSRDAGRETLCRETFMDARNALGAKCKQNKTLTPPAMELVAKYMAACRCESACK
jgi:hypothetical protein